MRPIPSVEEHHAWNHAKVVLPAMAELVPPVLLDDFGIVNVVDGPEMLLFLVQEDGLVDWLVLLVCLGVWLP